MSSTQRLTNTQKKTLFEKVLPLLLGDPEFGLKFFSLFLIAKSITQFPIGQLEHSSQGAFMRTGQQELTYIAPPPPEDSPYIPNLIEAMRQISEQLKILGWTFINKSSLIL